MNARNVKLVGGAIIAVIAIIGYFFVIAPFLEQRSVHASNIEEAESRISTVETQIVTLEQNRDQAPLVQIIDVAMSEAFPATADINTLREQIYNSASSAGVSVNVNSVVPVVIQAAPAEVPAADPALEGEAPADASADVPAEDVPAVPSEGPPVADQANIASLGVSISAEGQLDALLVFLDDMNTITRGMLITSSSINQQGEESGSYTLTFEATSFIHRTTPFPGSDEEAAQQAQEATDAAVNTPALPETTETEGN